MLDAVVSWITNAGPAEALGMALAMSCFLFFVLGKRSEFSQHAQQNIWATVVVYLVNIGLVVIFWEEINAFFQRAYDLIGLPTLRADFWDGTPLVLMCVIGIAIKDFADYWLHRAMHTPWLWPTHAAHHSDTHVNAFTSYRVHVIEYVFVQLGYMVLLTWLQMPETIPVVAAFLHLLNLYVHMDLDWGHGPLRYVLASPRYHRWHHADVPEAYGKNLANVIPLYDVVFGTYYNPAPCRAEMGAKGTGVDDKNPVQILIYPFLEWGRLIRGLFVRKAPDDGQPRKTASASARSSAPS